MNIEQAKAIPMTEILQKLNVSPSKENGVDLMYLSPLRKEKTPSFHVNTRSNVWFDHGIGEGGNGFDFVIAYMESQGEDHTEHDTLRWFNVMFKGHTGAILPIDTCCAVTGHSLRLKQVAQLQHPALIHYLQSRGIPLPAAQKYLKEVEVINTKTNKTFFAIGFKNEDGGYELRNKYFKGSVRSKYISLIRGSNPLSKAIHVFEGFLDFLSALALEKKTQFEEDVLVLNSISLLGKAYPYINNYGYEKLYSWLDNDMPGKTAARVLQDYLKKYSTIAFLPKNKSYDGHKDVNEWLMDVRRLKPNIKQPSKKG